MRHLSKQICWLITATVALGIGSLCPAQQAAQPAGNTDLAHYRQWRKVNPKPVRFAAAPAFQCAAAFPSQRASPHRDKFITVYVNPTAQKAMLQESAPKFPVGSVILKEKYAAATSKTPELMTVMRKHAPGYDAKNGDWEYLVLEGSAAKVQEQGHLVKCQECHRQVGTTDFVFRTPYLSAEQYKNLKPASGSVRPSY